MMFSNDPLGLAERFDKTHGDCVLYDYRYWFQDGARREKDCLGL